MARHLQYLYINISLLQQIHCHQATLPHAICLGLLFSYLLVFAPRFFLFTTYYINKNTYTSMFEFIPASSICASLSIKVESEVFIWNPESPNKQKSNQKKWQHIKMDFEHPGTATRPYKVGDRLPFVSFLGEQKSPKPPPLKQKSSRLSNLGSFCKAAAAKEAITLGLK